MADFDDELVVLVPDDRRAHHLDTVTSVVFDACSDGLGKSALAAELSETLGITTVDATEMVERVLAELALNGLVELGHDLTDLEADPPALR